MSTIQEKIREHIDTITRPLELSEPERIKVNTLIEDAISIGKVSTEMQRWLVCFIPHIEKCWHGYSKRDLTLEEFNLLLLSWMAKRRGETVKVDTPEIGGITREDGDPVRITDADYHVQPRKPRTAIEFLDKADSMMCERAAEYDKPGGERSMRQMVTAFNAITGRDLSETEGWLMMKLLKDVRLFSNRKVAHMDSLIDGVSYSALMAESAVSGGWK